MSDNMFAPVLDAGLTQTEFANIAGVCRATALYWVNGKKKPSHLHKARIAGIVDKIQELVEAHKLPLSPRMRGKQRVAELNRLILGSVTE